MPIIIVAALNKSSLLMASEDFKTKQAGPELRTFVQFKGQNFSHPEQSIANGLLWVTQVHIHSDESTAAHNGEEQT